MNAVKTVAQQIEQFGIFEREHTVNGNKVDIYRIDGISIANIERDKYDNIISITFNYSAT